jgi:hypothetical protein
MSWLKTPKLVFFVRSAEQNICPCCSGKLKVIGSRHRKYINSNGEKIVLVIRRLRCYECSRVHHELPDILIPYKRYSSDSIETVVTNDAPLIVAADESTIFRWRIWFIELTNHFMGSLMSIAIRYGRKAVEDPSCLPQSALQRIMYYVGDAPGWLARVVRPLVNTNLWIHTRSAFLS